MEKMLDLYSDYLLSSFQQTTATGLSRLTDGQISHDKVSRFLSEKDEGSKELWQHVKALVRKHETEDGCLIFDDSIIEKPYTDESELVCWHYDHSKGKSVKGNNILSAFYHSSVVMIVWQNLFVYLLCINLCLKQLSIQLLKLEKRNVKVKQLKIQLCLR